jgi:hypothetical protein
MFSLQAVGDRNTRRFRQILQEVCILLAQGLYRKFFSMYHTSNLPDLFSVHTIYCYTKLQILAQTEKKLYIWKRKLSYKKNN